MAGEAVDRLEGTLIEEGLDALEGGHLALSVLLVDRLFASIRCVGATGLQDLGLAGRGAALCPLRFGAFDCLGAHGSSLHALVGVLAMMRTLAA